MEQLSHDKKDIWLTVKQQEQVLHEPGKTVKPKKGFHPHTATIPASSTLSQESGIDYDYT